MPTDSIEEFLVIEIAKKCHERQQHCRQGTCIRQRVMPSGNPDLEKKSGSKKEKAGGRIESDASRHPRSDRLKRIMEQPLVDSEIHSKQVLKAGGQTDGRRQGSGCAGRQPEDCHPRLGLNGGAYQRDADEQEGHRRIGHHGNQARSETLEIGAVDSPAEEDQAAHFEREEARQRRKGVDKQRAKGLHRRLPSEGCEEVEGSISR